jgi:hypothetical protein
MQQRKYFERARARPRRIDSSARPSLGDTDSRGTGDDILAEHRPVASLCSGKVETQAIRYTKAAEEGQLRGSNASAKKRKHSTIHGIYIPILVRAGTVYLSCLGHRISQIGEKDRELIFSWHMGRNDVIRRALE